MLIVLVIWMLAMSLLKPSSPIEVLISLTALAIGLLATGRK